MGAYYVKRTEAQLWTVGFDTSDRFEPHSDHGDPNEAAEHAVWLNGGPEPAAIRAKNQREQRRYEIAKAVMGGLAACPNLSGSVEQVADVSVTWSDALLARLEK